jgi:hypothetical protein
MAEEGKALPSAAKSNAVNTHLAGEFFVAAELAKRGYTVSLTLGNAKAVDLIAEKDGFAVPIQVKAISLAKHAGWPIPHNDEKIVSRVVYVCVVLNSAGTPPDYYVAHPEEILQLRDKYKTRAILTLSKAKQADLKGKWSKLEAALGDRKRREERIF